MSSKTGRNKEKLQILLDKIKEIKRIPQGKISLLAGYETENYLSEIKSTGEISDNVIKALTNLYEKAKSDPSVLEKGYTPIKELPVEDRLSNTAARFLKLLEQAQETIKSQQETIRFLAERAPDISESPKNGSPPSNMNAIKPVK